jgi:hypothetical protein
MHVAGLREVGELRVGLIGSDDALDAVLLQRLGQARPRWKTRSLSLGGLRSRESDVVYFDEFVSHAWSYVHSLAEAIVGSGAIALLEVLGRFRTLLASLPVGRTDWGVE